MHNRAIVTGASRGIGRGVALELARSGCDVAFNYLNSEAEARSLVVEIEALGRQAMAVKADVSDLIQVRSFFAQVHEVFTSFNILVNNAGITRDKLLMSMKPEDWQAVIDTNLTGAFNCSRTAIVPLMKQRQGTIINISSVSGMTGMQGQVNYAASKAGMIGMTKALAKEVGRYGITVNAVAPGFIETDMLDGLGEKHRENMLAQIPLGYFGTVNHVARTVGFLVTEGARYITGQVITVDGGFAT